MIMDDIFTHVREGNAFQVRMWLDNTENDLNQGDDHRFSLLHWAARSGKINIVDMLIARGARVNATNMGDDTALHLAASQGHRDVVVMLLHNKANINSINEHGNTPLHYASFWMHDQIAEDLVNNGAIVAIGNKFNETALDKCRPQLAQMLADRALQMGQDLKPLPFEDRSWLGFKTRSRDATLSRNPTVDIKQVKMNALVACTPSADLYSGMWQGNNIVAKVLKMRHISIRNGRDFKEEYLKLRIFNHAHILPVLGATCDPPQLIIIRQYMQFGSLFNVLHGESDIVVDANQALRFMLDIARGMDFIHTLDPAVTSLQLNSKHVMIDEDLTARINMSDYKFSFHDQGKEFSPAWIAPEAMQKRESDLNKHAADMWSYAILLWELETREIPFADMAPLEIGMKVALEGLRISIPPGVSAHMSRLMKICMNEDPTKRPRFDMIIPIIEKIKAAG